MFYPFYLKKAMAHFEEFSHILLTTRADLNYSYEIEGKSKGEFFSLTLVAYTLGVGVSGNYIYQLLLS